MTTIVKSKSRQSVSGFSLIEVTLAMGMVATVLIALLAMLPIGMNAIRDAKNNMLTARIANEIMAEVQASDWGPPNGYPKLDQMAGPRYYNEEGILVKDADESSSDSSYTANVEIDATKRVRLPGAGTGSDSGRYLRSVTVKVAFAPNKRSVDWNSTAVPSPFKTYTSELVYMSKVKPSR